MYTGEKQKTLADRRSSVRGRPPRGADESPPTTTVARPAMCPERRRALANARLRRHRRNLKTGRLVLGAVEADELFLEMWLREVGMTLPRDPTHADIHAAWARYWQHQCRDNHIIKKRSSSTTEK